MKMSTFGPVSASPQELLATASKALLELRTVPKLLVVFTPPAEDPRPILASLRSLGDIPLVGATNGGAAFTQRGVTQDGVVGAFIGGENVKVECQPMLQLSHGLRSSVSQAFASIQPGDLPGHSVLVLADALACDGEALVKEIKQWIPSTWPLFGGFAGENRTQSRSRLFFNDTLIQDGAVIAYINDQSAPMVRARHGFAAIEGSREMKVTESEGNTVVSLDHQPAMEVYQEELARLQLLREGESFLDAATRHSLGIRSLWGEKLKIRRPIGTTGHSLVFVGSIPLGSSVRLVRSTPARMAKVSKQMISEVLAEKDAATLIIDCAVRWKLLGHMNQKQVEADLLESQGPVLGFTSYGEIAKYPGEMDCFYNMSTIAAAW